MARFVIVMAQGRSGSTLLLRMFNAVPGVHISGENGKAIDHLCRFARSFEEAAEHHHSEFFKLAWALPCPVEELKAKTASYLQSLYDPTGQLILAGFKEVRYGSDYDGLVTDVAFLRAMLPDLKIIFNTRLTESAVKSIFWKDKPKESRKILNATRKNFERYHGEHKDFTYMMPYEELHEGSDVLAGMFRFLDIEFTEAAQSELARRLNS